MLTYSLRFLLFLVVTAASTLSPCFLQAFNHWLKIPDDKLGQIGEITQMLHNASLL